MSEQNTDTTTSTDTSTRGPVAPQKPDVSAFGKRGRRVAAAQRATTSPAATSSTLPEEGATETADTPERSGQRPEQSGATPEPAESAPIPADPAEPASPLGVVPEPDSNRPHAPDGGRASDASAGDAAATASVSQDPEDEEADADEDNEDDYAAGKTTRQTYVPQTVATRFRRLQQTGKTAETIVLTAVENCADRVPDLIERARGPVQTGGLFPGLPVIEGSSRSRSTEDRPNNARIQYQVAPQYMPALLALARRHKIKLSKLVRLALGDYFGVPVRLNRVK